MMEVVATLRHCAAMIEALQLATLRHYATVMEALRHYATAMEALQLAKLRQRCVAAMDVTKAKKNCFVLFFFE
jgi:hypothetical protein